MAKAWLSLGANIGDPPAQRLRVDADMFGGDCQRDEVGRKHSVSDCCAPGLMQASLSVTVPG